MEFTDYLEYINIVNKTNDVFDSWFYQENVSLKNPGSIQVKKKINGLSFINQTDRILELLDKYKAPDSVKELFLLRQQLEIKIFRDNKSCDVPREELEEKIKEINVSYLLAS